MTNSPELTLFYDGACPLCSHEISYLQRHNTAAKVRFVDLNSPDLRQEFPVVDIKDAQQVLLAIDHNGLMLRGIDATHAAWQGVGKGAWVAPLRWRLSRPLALLGYAFFARHRQRISSLFKPRKERCDCK